MIVFNTVLNIIISLPPPPPPVKNGCFWGYTGISLSVLLCFRLCTKYWFLSKCWRGYYPFPKQALVFMCLQYKSLENTVEKGEIARNEQFLLFPQCFLLVWRTFCHLHQI